MLNSTAFNELIMGLLTTSIRCSIVSVTKNAKLADEIADALTKVPPNELAEATQLIIVFLQAAAIEQTLQESDELQKAQRNSGGLIKLTDKLKS